jgi:hypothetical protein
MALVKLLSRLDVLSQETKGTISPILYIPILRWGSATMKEESKEYKFLKLNEVVEKRHTFYIYLRLLLLLRWLDVIRSNDEFVRLKQSIPWKPSW